MTAYCVNFEFKMLIRALSKLQNDTVFIEMNQANQVL